MAKFEFNVHFQREPGTVGELFSKPLNFDVAPQAGALRKLLEDDEGTPWYVGDGGSLCVALTERGEIKIPEGLPKAGSFEFLPEALMHKIMTAAAGYVTRRQVSCCPETGVLVERANSIKAFTRLELVSTDSQEHYSASFHFSEYFTEDAPSYCWYPLSSLLINNPAELAAASLRRHLECQGLPEQEIIQRLESLVVEEPHLDKDTAALLDGRYRRFHRTQHKSYFSDALDWRVNDAAKESMFDVIRKFDSGELSAESGMAKLVTKLRLMQELPKDGDDAYTEAMKRLLGSP